MIPSEAAKVVIPFGHFNGCTIAEVHQKGGLNYLTNLRDATAIPKPIREAIGLYLDQPDIIAEMDRMGRK
jgi:hypothetical protein